MCYMIVSSYTTNKGYYLQQIKNTLWLNKKEKEIQKVKVEIGILPKRRHQQPISIKKISTTLEVSRMQI